MGDVVPLFSRVRSRRARADAERWFALGCELEDTAPARARRAYRAAVELDPDRADAHANLGRLEPERGRVADAETHYRRALAARPDEPTYWFNLGVALEDQGRDDAGHAYLSALERDPSFADAHHNLAGVLERRGDRAGALRHLAAYARLARRGS